MTMTVRQWTGLEAKALRTALRMTMHEFAGHLGVGTRTVAKWEARGTDIQPLPQTQAILDTALAKGASDVQARFAAAVSDQILLPLDAAAVTGRGMTQTPNLALSLGEPSRPDREGEAKPVHAERAYELYLRGQGLLTTNEKQRVEAAATLLGRALDIDPHFARAQAARGYAQWRQYFSGWGSNLSTLERALCDVDIALRLDPGSIGARTALIRICWDMGWHERALEIGRAIYVKNSDSLDATLAFARALNNAGMAEVALPLTRAVLHVDPTDPTALKLLIWNHLMVGDCTSALKAAPLPAHLSGRLQHTLGGRIGSTRRWRRP